MPIGRAEEYGIKLAEEDEWLEEALEEAVEEAVQEAVEGAVEGAVDGTNNFKNDPDGTWERNNQHMVKFTDELNKVNEQITVDYNNRKNPAEYDAEERKAMLEAVTEAFNAANWNGQLEQRLAAEDVAHNLFQPMYHRVEIAEAAAQHKFPDEFINALKEERIEYLEQKVAQDGLPTGDVQFQVQDYETALRMVEESKGTFHIVSTSRLDHFRDRFADALYNNQRDETAGAMMEHQMESAIAYYNGDLGRDDQFGQALRQLISRKGENWQDTGLAEEDKKEKEDEEEDPFAILWERGTEHAEEMLTIAEYAVLDHPEMLLLTLAKYDEPNHQDTLLEHGAEYDEPNHQEMLTFGEMESMNAYAMDQQISEILSQELHQVQGHVDLLKAWDHPDLNAVRRVQEAFLEIIHDGIKGSVENGNLENFTMFMSSIKGKDEELAKEMAQNTDFLDVQEEYEPPRFNKNFIDIESIEDYADSIEDTLDDYKDEMSSLNYEIATHLLDKLDKNVEGLRNIEKDWNQNYYQLTDPDDIPENIAEVYKVTEAQEYLAEAARIAEPLEYMTRPKNPGLEKEAD